MKLCCPRLFCWGVGRDKHPRPLALGTRKEKSSLDTGLMRHAETAGIDTKEAHTKSLGKWGKQNKSVSSP